MQNAQDKNSERNKELECECIKQYQTSISLQNSDNNDKLQKENQEIQIDKIQKYQNYISNIQKETKQILLTKCMEYNFDFIHDTPLEENGYQNTRYQWQKLKIDKENQCSQLMTYQKNKEKMRVQVLKNFSNFRKSIQAELKSQ